MPNKNTIKIIGETSATQIFECIKEALCSKVGKVEGKDLSSNDYTTAEKNKLGSIEEGANKYTHPTHTARNSGLYKITVDSAGHVVSATLVTKQDIIDLGINGDDTEYSEATTSEAGLMSASDKSKLDGIENGANKTVVDSSMSNSSTNPVQNKVIHAAIADKLSTSLKGSAGGLAELDSSGKVPASQLPSYVDDVIEGTYVSATSFKDTSNNAVTGESGKIYVDTTSSKTYRWSGSAFVEISASLALGETSSTAYRGDRGKTAYDHSQITSGNPHNVSKSDLGLGNVENKSSATIRGEITKSNVTNALGYTPPQQDTVYTHPSHTARSSGLYKITVDSQGHVTAVTAVSKSDITGLGIPGQDTTYTHPSYTAKSSGLYKITVDSTGHVSSVSAVSKSDITGLGIPAQDTTYTHPSHTARSSGLYKITVDSQGHITGATAVAKSDITGLGIPAQDTTYTFNGAVSTIKDSNLTASRALVSNSSGKVAVSAVTSTELGYLDGVTSAIQTQLNSKAGTSVATQSANGLMSSTDKTKLDRLPNTMNVLATATVV